MRRRDEEDGYATRVFLASDRLTDAYMSTARRLIPRAGQPVALDNEHLRYVSSVLRSRHTSVPNLPLRRLVTTLRADIAQLEPD